MDVIENIEENYQDILVSAYWETLLVEWELPHLIIDFRRKGIDIEIFKVLIEDINHLIGDEQFGTRIKFRKKLFDWRINQGYATPLASTVWNSTESWVQSLNISSNSTKEQEPAKWNLDELLQKSIQGTAILEKKTEVLTKDDRKYISTIIAEEWIKEQKVISIKEKQYAPQQITKNFSSEIEDRACDFIQNASSSTKVQL